jgi:DNA-binding transcriptional regulator YhcF (GntR family)
MRSGTLVAALASLMIASAAEAQSESKAVASGGVLRLAHFASVNPDYTSRGITVVRVTDAPSHGSVQTRRERGFTTFRKQTQCDVRRVDGVTVEYRPERGYLGTDRVGLDVIFPSFTRPPCSLLPQRLCQVPGDRCAETASRRVRGQLANHHHRSADMDPVDRVHVSDAARRHVPPISLLSKNSSGYNVNSTKLSVGVRVNKAATISLTLGPALNRTQELTQRLTAAIVNGRLRPGARLPTEKELCRSTGVSRSVVREAVAALRADGLVITQQGRGAFVPAGAECRPFRIDPAGVKSAEDVLQILELRTGLEIEASGLAAERRTSDDLRQIEAALLAIEPKSRPAAMGWTPISGSIWRSSAACATVTFRSFSSSWGTSSFRVSASI